MFYTAHIVVMSKDAALSLAQLYRIRFLDYTYIMIFV
jgi:hypothetical protein